MINTVTLIGRIGNDPELRTTDKGSSLVKFPLAYHEYKQVEGERQSVTHWFNCCAFGSLAEICSEFLHKGARVGIQGQLQHRTWNDKEGEKKGMIEILIRDIEFLSNGNGKK